MHGRELGVPQLMGGHIMCKVLIFQKPIINTFEKNDALRCGNTNKKPRCIGRAFGHSYRIIHHEQVRHIVEVDTIAITFVCFRSLLWRNMRDCF